MDKFVKFRIVLETNGNKVLHNLSVNSEDFRKAVDDATSEVQHLGDVFGSLAERGVIFSAVREAVLALQDAIGGLADEFNDFDEGMRKANTMAHVSGKELKGLKESIEDMAGVIPLVKRELTEGLYQVISNGVPKENWIDFLRASARSAVGGIADLGQTVTVTSTIIKNYALDWDRAGEIQDKIQTTAQNGVTSFEQLAAALPRVTGNAATLGVSIDELMATFATLTGVSGNTAEVSTQLAAVFTALVKPSGEAAEMAEQMGIRFDAAAIKAAGGMRNFLTTLRHDVEEYAAASGILEQEIYGRLFGSAESLRALIPLTGNLADAFTRNIDAMSDSAGTMDAAFDDMAGSGRSVEQLLKNQLGTMTDWAGRMASMIKPYVSFVAVAGQAVYGLTLMTQAFRKLKVSIAATTLAQKANIVVSRLAAVHSKIVASAQLFLSRAGYTAAAGTWALNAAVTVLYATLTMGIALVIEGIAMLFSKMGHKSEEAAGKMDILKESSDAFKSTFSDVKAEMDMELIALQRLITAHGEVAEAVNNLNSKYGEALGHHETAAEWYDTLIAKSREYATQLAYEAQAKQLASQIAAKELERDEITRKMGTTSKTITVVGTGGVAGVAYTSSVHNRQYDELEQQLTTIDAELSKLNASFDTVKGKAIETAEGLKASAAAVTKAVTWETMSYQDLGNAIEKQKKKYYSLYGAEGKEVEAHAAGTLLNRMEARYEKLGAKFNKPKSQGPSYEKKDGPVLIENAKTYSDLSNNIAYWQHKLEETDKTDVKTIATLTNKINILKEEQAAFDAVEAAASRPKELKTLKDIDSEIAYQMSLRNTATSEELAGIDEIIDHLNAEKRAFEESSHTPLKMDGSETFEQLDKEIAFYEERLRHANMTEAEGIKRTLNLLREKRESMGNILSITDMQQETEKFEGMDEQQLKVELKLIGLEEIQSRLRLLRNLLKDTRLPMTDEQKEALTKLIGKYEEYGNTLAETKNKGDLIQGSLQGMSSIMGSLSGIVGEGAAGWLSYGANVLSAIAAMLPALASVIGGNIAQAFAGAAAQSQKVPFPYNLVALAASMAAVAAAVATIPKFAEGGIVYGPTMGIFGEYSGASTNPEVVAPLDKLRTLISPSDSGIAQVEFKIEGRTLKGILDKENIIRRRTN